MKKLSHKLRQVYYYHDERYKYGDLENDVKYYVNENFFLGNVVDYSHKYETFSRNQSLLIIQIPFIHHH